jgi:hypothetical protein
VADPHTLHLDGPTRPWEDVPDLVRCGACFGALPPDTTAACKYCGEGTPPGLTVLQPLAAPPAGRTSWATWPNSLEPDKAPAPTPPPTTGPEMAIRVEVSMPAEDRTDWAWTDVSEFVTENDPPRLTVSPSQTVFTPTGGLHYPPPPRRWRLVSLTPAPRLPWWRRIWRRRG